MNKWGLVLLLPCLMSCSSPKRYDVEYYKDGTFRNLENHQQKSFFAYFWMRLNTKQEKWPEFVPLEVTPQKPLERSDNLRVHYINHSMFLIQYQNYNILTDPVLSERVSPVTWAGPKRVTPAGLTFEQIPKVDVIIISHDHYDHLDLATLKKFYERDRPLILVGLGVGRVFDDEAHTELKWGQEILHEKIKITFVPAQHFSGRTLTDRNTTLWGAYVIQFSDRQIYFAGDTGYSSHFRQAQNEYGPMDLSLIPIGAYDPRDFMEYHHVDPEQAYQAHQDLKSRFSMGMHWGTFQLTNEAREEPKTRLQAVALQNNDKTFIAPLNGECWEQVSNTWKSCSASKP